MVSEEEVGTWYLLHSPPSPGPINMAIDEGLRRLSRSSGKPSLRFYTWDPPALSLGRAQDASGVVDFEYCATHGIDVVRRPTGGRAVLHHDELTYCVTGRLGTSPFPRSLQETYRTLSVMIAECLQSLGIPALIWEQGEVRALSPKTPAPCFTRPGPGEIAADGKKLVGSAMQVDRGWFLQHGSIILDQDPEMERGAQRYEVDRPSATVRSYLPGMTTDALAGHIADHFATRLSIAWKRIDADTVPWSEEEAMDFLVRADRCP